MRRISSFGILLLLISIQKFNALAMNVAERVTRALDHHNQGRFNEALVDYLSVVNSPDLQVEGGANNKIIAQLHSNAGVIYMQQGDYNEAKSHFSQAVSANPNDVSALMNLAIILTSKLDQHRVALKTALKVVKISPENPKGYHLLGNILQNMGREQEAEQYFIMAEQLAQEASATGSTESKAARKLADSLEMFRRVSGVSVGDVLAGEVEGKEYRMECVSLRPLVFLAPNFLTAAECEHVMSRSADKLEKSFAMGGGKVEGGQADESIADPVDSAGQSAINSLSVSRATNDAAWLAPRDSYNTWLAPDEVLLRFQERLSALTEAPMSYLRLRSEELQVVKYREAGYFNMHQDSSTFHQRIVTALLYLNHLPDGAGGETWFPFAGVERSELPEIATVDEAIAEAAKLDPYQVGAPVGLLVKPKLGDAVIFFNHDIKDGALDPYAVHAGLKLRDGFEKWVANYWID